MLMPPKFDPEYQPRKTVCGCSRCSNHIPSISNNEKYKENKSFWDKYAGPIIFTIGLIGAAIWGSYQKDSAEENTQRNNSQSLSDKVK